MFDLIKQLFASLTQAQKKSFIVLQLLIIISSIFEVIGIASIIPFISLISNINLLKEDGYIAEIYQYSGIEQPNDFLFFLGICVFVLMSLSSILSITKLWYTTYFSNKVGFEIGGRLYHYYINQTWLFHTINNSSFLTNKIAVEAIRVKNICKSVMQINAQIFLGVFMFAGLVFINIKITFIGIACFMVLYFSIYKFIKNILLKNGKKISMSSAKRFKLISEGFGGIKDILLLGRQEIFE